MRVNPFPKQEQSPRTLSLANREAQGPCRRPWQCNYGKAAAPDAAFVVLEGDNIQQMGSTEVRAR